MENATEFLETLDADEIRRRLERLNAEQQALRVLLRAAVRIEDAKSIAKTNVKRQDKT